MGRDRDNRRFVYDDPLSAILGYAALRDVARRYRLYRCRDGGKIAFVWARSPREALGRAARKFGVSIWLANEGDSM